MKHLILSCLIFFTLFGFSQSAENGSVIFNETDLRTTLSPQKSTNMTGLYKMAPFDAGLRLQCGLKMDPQLRHSRVISASYANDTLNLHVVKLKGPEMKRKKPAPDLKYFYLYVTLKEFHSIPKTILINSKPMNDPIKELETAVSIN